MLGVVATAWPACCGADELLPAPATYGLPRVGPAPGGDVRTGAQRRAAPPDGGVSPTERSTFDLRPAGSSATLLEMPPDFRPGGRSSRPHHALGFRSTLAETWLREQGVDASRCYLPLIRARTRISNGGGASSAVWVYARCSLR
jgi:hypothetical protein